MDYAIAKKLVKGTHVTVVGLQKSALDNARECSSANGEEHTNTANFLIISFIKSNVTNTKFSFTSLC